MKIEVSDGELVDKAAILHVKLERISDPEKVGNIKNEYRYLMQCLAILEIDGNSDVFVKLVDIHRENWELIEIWNLKDSAGEYDDEYLEAVRRSNRCNRERFSIKAFLNRHSTFVEEKSEIYEDYKNKGGQSYDLL